MEFLKFRDVRWKGPEKRNKPDVVATTAKHPDSRRQISRYGKGTCGVSHFVENLLPAAVSEPAVAICLNSLMMSSGRLPLDSKYRTLTGRSLSESPRKLNSDKCRLG